MPLTLDYADDHDHVVGMMVAGDNLNLRYLNPLAQRLLADFLTGRAHEEQWDWAVRGFLWACDLGRNDKALRAALITGYRFGQDFLPTERGPLRRWEDELVEQTRALPAVDVPYLSDRYHKTTALNLIAETDAGTGMFVRFLATLWPGTCPGSTTTFGDVIDTYRAAALTGKT